MRDACYDGGITLLDELAPHLRGSTPQVVGVVVGVVLAVVAAAVVVVVLVLVVVYCVLTC